MAEEQSNASIRAVSTVPEAGTDEALAVHKKKMKKSLVILVVIAAVIAVALVAVKLLQNPNRSAKAAAKATFTCLYISFDYDDFTECTVYNEVCQGELKLELTEELSTLETEFSTLEEYMENAGEHFTIDSVTAEVYDAEDDGYETGLALFADAYTGLEKKAVTGVAKATVTYEETYKDESGNTVSDDGTDTLWCYEVDGKWYCHPGMIEE